MIIRWHARRFSKECVAARSPLAGLPTAMNDTQLQNTTITATPKSQLGASLCADYEALKNDLDQAKELASDFQRQLAGKSNEVAHFKVLLERAQTDFTRLEGHIEELRRERHRLANEVMRGTALEMKMNQKNQEIDRLREQVDTLRDAGGKRVEELLLVSEDQQREIQRLRSIVEVLRKKEGIPPILAATERPEMREEIAELRATVKRLQAQLSQSFVPAGVAAGGETDEPEFTEEVINLSFEK
jgi:chromosome segregation ATPase